MLFSSGANALSPRLKSVTRARFPDIRPEPSVDSRGRFPREPAGPALGPRERVYGDRRKRVVYHVDPRNGSGDGYMAMMIVVVGDGGGGKYGTPGAGVIIYLAPEIGPADTAGRFNGRTMLELTKTKTKHQLGDFFFHFSFTSFTFARSLSDSFLLAFFIRVRFSSVTSKKRSGEGAYNVYAWSTHAILG